MKKLQLTVTAPKEQLRAQAAKRAEELKKSGAHRVLVVYDDAEHARVYPDQPPLK